LASPSEEVCGSPSVIVIGQSHTLLVSPPGTTLLVNKKPPPFLMRVRTIKNKGTTNFRLRKDLKIFLMD
jgi:hypothetical protein